MHTDHKPLLSIFGEDKGLPIMAAARMQRWAFILSGFNYKIKHVKGLNNHADSLSRMPQPEPIETTEDAHYVNYIESENSLQLNFQNIANETRRDPILSKLFDAIQKGTVKELKEAHFKPYHSKSEEISIESGCILWGYRVVIPNKLRKQILQDLHKSHMGIVKTKALARSYLWWPNLDCEIESMIKHCVSCQLTLSSPEKSALIPWQPTNCAWSRIHVDYAGPIKGFYFLVVFDSFSKWVEVFKTKTITAAFTISKLRETFCRYGLVDTIVSDNGTQFKCEEFLRFTTENHIKHTFTAPGKPATNGQAENFVKTFKKSLYANLNDSRPDNIDIILNRFLIDYRNTKHCATGESPSKIMFGRELKTRFSLLKPPLIQDKILNYQEKAIKNSKGKRDCEFALGEKVFVRDYTNPNKPSWTEATIDKCFGPRNYGCILTKNDRLIKRHLDQIRSFGTDHKEETVEHETSNDGIDLTESPNATASTSTVEIFDDEQPLDDSNEVPLVDEVPEQRSDSFYNRSFQLISHFPNLFNRE